MNIASLDNQINQLIDDVSNAVNIHSNDLLKSKVAFQLTKINLGLRLIKRVMKLYDLQEVIEDQMLNEDAIKDLSSRELLVMMKINSSRLNDYYGKMDRILSSLNLRELEGSLLVLAEVSAKAEANTNQLEDKSSESLKTLSLQALSSIGHILKAKKDDKVPVPVGDVIDVQSKTIETDLVSDEKAASNVTNRLDDLVEAPDGDDDDVINLPE